MNPSTWLVVEQAGSLWALPAAKVRELERDGTIAGRDGASAHPERILALARNLEARPWPQCLNAWGPPATVGLALWGERPVVLLDPDLEPRWAEVTIGERIPSSAGDSSQEKQK